MLHIIGGAAAGEYCCMCGGDDQGLCCGEGLW